MGHAFAVAPRSNTHWRARESRARATSTSFTLSKPENPTFRREAIVVPVEDGRYTPYHAAIPHGQVKTRLGIGVERMPCRGPAALFTAIRNGGTQ